jgi:isoamylase
MKKILLSVILSGLVVTACRLPAEDYIRKYAAHSHAPSYSTEDIKNLKYLGSKVVDYGVSFNIYSENASRVELLLFEDPDGRPSHVYQMSRFENVWSLYIEGIGERTYYGFRMWGPNWPWSEEWYPGSDAGFQADYDEKGNRFNPNKVLIDPYARAYHRDHDWTLGTAASGPYRNESTVEAAAKSIVLQDGDYAWDSGERSYWKDRQQGRGLADHELIVYEVHLKGLTKNPGSGVKHPGTYRGVGEMADYLKDLGITAVEFLPIHEKPVDGGYWGYWTLGFFAPENTYADDSEEGSQVHEFKWMVEQLHQRGIEVWLDVVYNHTGEGGLWREYPPNATIVQNENPADFWYFDPPETATILGFRGIDNIAYYQLDPYSSNPGFYWEHTGVGNGWRANHQPGHQLIMDSLRYWSDEMHVDGFRFDLAAQLGEENLDYEAWSNSTILQDIANDKVLQKNRARIVAEPWDAGGHYVIGQFPVSSSYADNGYGWYEWNGQFRDVIRPLLNEDSFKLNGGASNINVGGALTGSRDLFGEGSCPACDPRKPLHSINFITAHDGFTLYDLFSYNEKRNGKGPLNPEGEDALSGDSHNHSRDWGGGDGSGEPLKRQMVRNAAVLLFLSQGTPMMLGGDEWMRTQYGNNNAYTTGADNTYNWFRWSNWRSNPAAVRMHDFFKKIIRFRKNNCSLFCRTQWETDDGTSTDLFSWKKADGNDADASTWSAKNIGLHYWNVDREIFMVLNLDTGSVNFTLPGGRTWQRVIDTQAYFEGDSGESGNFFQEPVIAGASYDVQAHSIVVFQEAE